MTQHTLGLWVVEATLGPEILSIVTEGRTFEWKHVAQINTEDCELSVARANARLIAAAPELLAVARQVIENAAATCDRMWVSDAKLAEMARAAIAKAEGSR